MYSNQQEVGLPLKIKDDGLTLLDNTNSIDFRGDGVSGSLDGLGGVEENIPGGGGGGGNYTPQGTTKATVGGIASGTDLGTDPVPVQDIFDDMLYPYTAPAITLTSTPATGVREFGNTSASVGLTATTTKNTNPITRVRFYRGSTMIHEVPTPNASGGVETHTDNTELAVSTTYTARVFDGTQEVTSNIRAYNFVFPYYYGVGAKNLTPSQIAGLTKAVVASGNKTYTFNPTAQVFYFAYPLSYPALTSIKDPNQFDMIDDFTVSTKSITGLDGTAQNYRVYEYNHLTTQVNFSITFTQ
jgi:hypothetical protein